jgi:RimJ/RimL family protein N-acetyltransferase
MQNFQNYPLNSLRIIQTTDIVNFLPLLKELEFGDKFELAMLKWCNIVQRDPSISFWQVYIAKLAVEPIGVIGLYQLVDSPADIVWLGWFGLRPHFRRQGWGTIMLNQLKKYAREFKFKELWVFTNDDNLSAISFYEKNGFIKLGAAIDISPGNTHELSDVILKCNL